MAEVALGLDLGTSGVRVLAVDGRGEVVAEVTRAYPLLTPKPGWTEQRPEDWSQASLEALAEMSAGIADHDVVSLGLSGQMHGMVPLDAEGKAIRPALLWNDQRTSAAVREIEDTVGRDVLIERTGNPAVTGFQLPKVIWLRNAEPENYAKLRHVLLPKDYIGYVLTGEMAAEPTDASGTNCFHLASKTWDHEILRALDVDPDFYPRVIASHEIVGGLTEQVAKRTGLPAKLPVVAGAGDNAAAATGLGLSSERLQLGSVSLGTSGVIFAPIREPTPDPAGRVHLFCHSDGGYNLLGVTLAAAGSLEWYRRTFAPSRSFEELGEIAAQSRPGANGVVFKPYLAGERTPHMDPDLRGSWTGLSLATTEADVVRSVLEGVAFSLRDALEVMEPLATLEEALVTGGGAKSDLWLQITADVLGLSLSRPAQNQGAAYGAALLAFQGTGHVDSTLEIAQAAPRASFEPSGTDYDAAWERYREAHRAVRDSPRPT